jgi:hypothetical protein
MSLFLSVCLCVRGGRKERETKTEREKKTFSINYFERSFKFTTKLSRMYRVPKYPLLLYP